MKFCFGDIVVLEGNLNGFAMSNVSVYVFDNVENREVKSFEYKKETSEFVAYLSINRWL